VVPVTLSVLSACGTTGASLSARRSTATAAYVCVFASPSQPGTSLARIDLSTDRVETPLRTTVSEPSAVVSVPLSNNLLVVGTGDDQLVEIDPRTAKIAHRIVVGLQPDAVAVTPGGTRALVADSGSGRLTVVDLRTGAITGSVPVGSVPAAVAVGGLGSRVAVVADEGQDAAVVVSLGTLRVGPPITVGAEPDAVAVTPAGIALVANLGSDSVTPIDLATGVAGPPIPVAVPPTGLAVSPLAAPGSDRADDPAGTAWVTGGGALVPINLTTMTVGSPVAIGHPAEAVALTAGGHRAVIADQDARVTIVDLPEGRIVATTFVGGRPSAILVSGQ